MNNKSHAKKKVPKRTRTPKIRFPEFQADEDWKETELGQLGKTLSGLTYAPKDVRASGLLVLRSSNVQDGKITLDDCVYVTPNVKGANLSKPNDILICVRNGSISLIGKNAIIPEGMPLCTHGAFMTIFRSEAPKFVYQLLQTQAYLTQVAADLGARINSINNSQLINYKFWIPPTLAEQEKIANCLSFLDELIAAHGQKLDALKAHKKGLMQQLFPRAGETLPCLRFPEFQNAPEWKKQKLTELVNLVSGMHLSPDEYGKESGIPYFTGPSDFTNDFQGVTKWTNESTSIAKENDILITVKGSGVGEIWYLTLPSVAMGRQLMAVRTKGSSSHFVCQFLLTKRIRFEDLASGNLIPGLSRGDILDLEAPFPMISEQQKIADCLAALDDLISAQTQKLDALKTYKKGLMQQLFPSPEEIEA